MSRLEHFLCEPTLTPFEAGVVAIGAFILALGLLSVVL